MSKTLHFLVTIPDIPDGMSDEEVRDWLWNSILHPYDAAYEANVRVTPMPDSHVSASAMIEAANPERDGNGCMIYGKDSTE